jgi:hypothetical protein
MIRKIIREILANRDESNNTPAMDLQSIFDRMDSIKDEDLENPKEDESKEAFAWYEQHALEVYEEVTKSSSLSAKTKQRVLLNSIPDFYDGRKRAGALYTFTYEPESDLPYWDKFPLVLRIIDNLDSTESFLGINIHYLEPKLRRLFMMHMLTKMGGSIEDKNSRIVGLNMKKLMTGLAKYGRVCIRRYKYDNVRGRVLTIPPENWVKMMYLPTYQFIGSKPNRVWRDSYKKIRKLR